jgi:hypothetical protein
LGSTPRIEIDSSSTAEDHRHPGGDAGDAERVAGAVDDPGEDVAAAGQVHAEPVRPADAAKTADRGGVVRVDQAVVERGRVLTLETGDHGREYRHQDQQDHQHAAGHRHLVPLQPGPRDPTEGAPFDRG